MKGAHEGVQLFLATALGLTCFALPSSAAPAVSTALLVQPGRVLITPTGGRCTMGFLFQSTDGAVFGTSAGHCAPVDLDLGQSSWPRGTGPVVRGADGTPIGRLVYSRFTRSSNPDLSVFEVRTGLARRAGMCMFGGPTSLLTGAPTSPVLLLTYGHGDKISLISRARAAVAPRIPRQTHVQATGLALNGDSGSPVQTSDGQALGISTDFYLAPTVAPGAGRRFRRHPGHQPPRRPTSQHREGNAPFAEATDRPAQRPARGRLRLTSRLLHAGVSSGASGPALSERTVVWQGLGRTR